MTSTGPDNAFPASGAIVTTGRQVLLRPLHPDDLEYLYRWENDPAVWPYGDCGAEEHRGPREPQDPEELQNADARPTPSPQERFTRCQLREFIANQQHGLSANGQLRLVICLRPPKASTSASSVPTVPPVGFIDLFDLDPVALSAGVGILVCDPADRRKGYGREALQLTIDYARRQGNLRSLWCTLSPDNPASLALFTAAGFTPTPLENGLSLNSNPSPSLSLDLVLDFV